ncbi:sirohydrochlorin cobaltochelatase [uncultured Dialister sp.]|jgi:sirohydrochlorin cobaltochelatase|uniref:sirohydrochlorin cobaltochelatase n=1 Tax=uncultured Dialister sp. TaxID=278064 RepID=UPI0025E20341|nr:sirohydrochlorin cobaltochelatase [uncultured Dialister sp.]
MTPSDSNPSPLTPSQVDEEERGMISALRQASSIGVKVLENESMKGAPDKDAILVMAFGTTYSETRRKTIEAVEADIHRLYPDIPIFEAYTSKIIIRRVHLKENILKASPARAFQRLKDEGYTRIAVVALNIIPGIEYDYTCLYAESQLPSFKEIAISTPLLYFQGVKDQRDDIADLLEAMKSQFPQLAPGEAILLMAHGTPHPANAYYSVIQDRIGEMGLGPVFVYTVEGRPSLEDMIPRLKENHIRHVTLMPTMLVAGDHANNDMAGDDPDSHKNILIKEGFTVSTYIHGLGENEKVRRLYTARAIETMKALHGEN